MKKVLLITRPLTPPWDEASKIFAFYLAKNSRAFSFTVLTKGHVVEMPDYVTQKPIYTSTAMAMSILERARLLKIFPMRNHFDIIHFMMTPNKLNTLGFKTFLTGKRAKTIQSVATLREDLFSDNEFKKILFADLIITYSDYAKNKLEKIGINAMRIYPGIDTEIFSPQIKDTETQNHFGIKEEDFIITYPGEYTRLGATDDIVNSLPELFNKIPNSKFVFACRVKNDKDAIKKAEVVETLTKMGIISRVIFTDTFSDMPKLYNISDVIAFPVRDMKGKFDVPLIVIEAMACNKPVVISNLPILKEFTSNENAVIIETGNNKQFISAVQSLFLNPEKRKAIGQSARKYACENFDINSVAKKYEEAYTKLLS